jgi:hypothetical protein
MVTNVNVSGYGSVQNAMLGNHAVSSTPTVGMDATIVHYSDRTPARVVEVSPSGKRVKVVDLDWRVVSGSMQDGSAVYEYSEPANAHAFTYTLRKSGRWVMAGADSFPVLVIGHASKYEDPSF